MAAWVALAAHPATGKGQIMAATLTTAYAGTDTMGPESRRSARASEIWTVTGSTSVANDTGTITPKYIKRPQQVIGQFAYSISGQTITLTDLVGIGNSVLAVEVIGYLS